ncbi:hypothetical protein ASPSYDRAFT_52587, partial [Aspergillus sydowii CBS 593.65]
MNGVLADHPDHPLTRDQGEHRATLTPTGHPLTPQAHLAHPGRATSGRHWSPT